MSWRTRRLACPAAVIDSPSRYVTDIPETRYSFGLRQRKLTAATLRVDC